MSQFFTFQLLRKLIWLPNGIGRDLLYNRLICRTLMVLASLLFLSSASISETNAAGFKRWVGSWGTAPAGLALNDDGSPVEPLQLENKTLRLIVHSSTGGREVRIRISNLFGTAALKVGSAAIALREQGSAINVETSKELTFSGYSSISIPPGASVVSDVVKMRVPRDGDLSVSMYFPEPTEATTVHSAAFQTSYVASGEAISESSLDGASQIESWPFLTTVEVKKRFGASVVALGDSITDGFTTTSGLNNRWPDLLSDRLRGMLGVINKGIGGNRLLSPSPALLIGEAAGPAGLARLDRDVFSQSGVRYLIVLLGINDIGLGGLASPEQVTLEQMIAGYRQVIARARSRGIKVFGATLLPFEGAFPGYYSPEKDVLRGEVNNWIRTSGEFDGVIDFDKAVRDPDHPSRLLPEYDSGDHLHPSDAGMQAMANAIPLSLFWQ